MAQKINGLNCVLLVDDEAIVRNAGRRILTRFGCEVLLAEDGEEALEVYREAASKIDVVILDLTMPVMDGNACLEKLKQINPSVRVVLSSGAMESADPDLAGTIGASGILPKPYDLQQLVNVFERIFPPSTTH